MKFRNKSKMSYHYRIYLYKLIMILALALSCIALTKGAFAYDLERKVQEFTLENGLRVLIVERHFSPTVSFYIRYKVGAVDESSEHTGTAHFLEHMLFKGTRTIGTKNFEEEKKILNQINKVINALDIERMKGKEGNKSKIDELNRQLEALQKDSGKLIIKSEIDRLYTENGGADMNASTGYDLTSYHVSLPSNKVELWARIESDRMINPVFREFFSERNVVIEERKQTVESNPQRKLMEQFLATAFMVHPYRRPILGWASDMYYLNVDYLRNFFKTYHAPDNTVIAVVGDVSASELMKMIKKYFGGIPSQKKPVSHFSEEPVQQGERRVELVSDANPYMMIGYHKPTLPSFDDYVFDVIDTILSRGRTARLFKVLVEKKGIATSIDTANGFPGARCPNLFVFFATPRCPHINKELEDAIYEEIEKLKKEPVTARELEKAKNQMRADFLRRLSSNSGIANMLSYFEAVAGDYRYITNHINMIEKITAEDIMKVAKKYFNSENRTVASLVGIKE